MNLFSYTLHDLKVFYALDRNQKSIVRVAESANETIHLQFKPLVKGSVDRYYHFVFDVLAPISRLVQYVPNATFSVIDKGPFMAMLPQLFPNVVLVPKHSNPQPCYRILGMNPKKMKRWPLNFTRFRKDLLTRMNVVPTNSPRKILLIERTQPSPYYRISKRKKSSDTDLRSIINHLELKEMLRTMVAAPYEFHNLVLTSLSLAEQATLFSEAVLVIAQHGAGLANTVWMQPGTNVVELGYQERPHFKKLSKACNLRYYLYQKYSVPHITVALDEFRNWLQQSEKLHHFFD